MPYTTRAMYKIKITVLKKDLKAIEHIKKLRYDDIDIEYTEHVHRIVFQLSSPDPNVLKNTAKEIVSNLIISYYKLQYILTELRYALTPELIALIGTIVAFRHTEECEMVAEKLKNLDEINIDGLLNFKLCELTNEWCELGRLANRLLSQCDDENDVYELIAFMMGLEPVKKAELVLDASNHLYLDDVKKTIFKYFDKTYENIIYTMLFFRPNCIIIKEPALADPNIVECIKNLGK